MSRRDTIIIAVLANAALLAILFMMAVNSDDDKLSDQSEIKAAVVEAKKPLQIQESEEINVVTDASSMDEVDNALKELSLANSQTVLPPQMVMEEAKPMPSQPSVTKTVEETPRQKDAERYVEITVKKGDFLEKIAKANGTTIDAIKKANNLANEKLSIGQILRVPISSKKIAEVAKQPESKPTPPQAIQEGGPQYYTIKSGDNPWKIAKQFQVKFDDLLKLNHLDEEKARNLKVGDKIRVK